MSDPRSNASSIPPPSIRRQPTGPIPTTDAGETQTSIIRRMPTGRTGAVPTTAIPDAPRADSPTSVISRAAPVAVPARPRVSTGRTAIAASAVSIISGWATSVVATDLIAGWWTTDRLFCLAVGFLTLLFAVTTIAGVIALLLRRTVGRYLIAFGAIVALLTFGSVFIAGARIAWPVYAIPVLPATSLGLAMHAATRRWCGLR